MRKRKSFYVLYLLALVFITSACQSQEEKDDEVIIEITDDEEAEVEETEADAEIGEGETGEAVDIVLSDEDALRLVEEKLPDDSYEAQMYGNISKDDTDYCLFEIKKDGQSLKQMLAVNDETGEVYTYDDKSSEISAYSDFEFYDASKDASVDWSGVYSNDKFSVSIDNTDPGNIEYCVMQGKKTVYANVAYFEDYANAISETDEYGKINLQLKDGSLTLKSESECEFALTYKIEILR